MNEETLKFIQNNNFQEPLCPLNPITIHIHTTTVIITTLTPILISAVPGAEDVENLDSKRPTLRRI
jgi:hypothetical protein